MTVGELLDLLIQVDRTRTVYVPGKDGQCDPAHAVVDLRHCQVEEVFGPGVRIPDDVVILPASMMEQTETE